MQFAQREWHGNVFSAVRLMHCVIISAVHTCIHKRLTHEPHRNMPAPFFRWVLMKRPTYIRPLPEFNTIRTQTLNAGNAAMRGINTYLHITPIHTSSTGAAINIYNKYAAYLAMWIFAYKISTMVLFFT